MDPRLRSLMPGRTMNGEQLLDTARAELGRIFGFPGFRPGQE